MNNTMLELRLEVSTEYERLLKLIRKINDKIDQYDDFFKEFDKNTKELETKVNDLFILFQNNLNIVEINEIKMKLITSAEGNI